MQALNFLYDLNIINWLELVRSQRKSTEDLIAR